MHVRKGGVKGVSKKGCEGEVVEVIREEEKSYQPLS